jgi:hypothetical protein
MRGLLLRPRAWLLVLIPIAVSAASLPARAQDASALDKKARDAFERKDFAGAAEAFEEAYGFRPHPATKYNAAFAWEKAGEKARAADAYEAALNSDGLDAKRSEAARSRLSVLKPQLAYVIVEKPIGGTVTVEHVKDVPIPARIHLDPGSHLIVIRRSNGKKTDQQLALKAGSTTPIVVEDDDSPALDAPLPEKKPEPKKEAPPPVQDEGSCSSCTWGWVAIGGAVVAAGAGTYFGLKTLSANDDFEASERTDTDAHDRAVSSRTLSNVMFGVAAVAGGVGIYLVLTGKKSKPETTSLVLGVHPQGVSTKLTF